jgi:hypothetical protein
MIEAIGEVISVEALFQEGRLIPRLFNWRRRSYPIKQITGHWSEREGQFRRYHYTVATDQPDIYELAFSTRDLGWQLVSVYYDG